MTQKRATMIDVARAAGVSQATVSLVLNNVAHARVSTKTRAKVAAVAAALGYSRKPATTMSIGAPVIGMLIDELSTTPFSAPLIEGARDEAAAQGALLAVICTRADPEAEAAALEMLGQTNLLGILYTTLVTRAVTVSARMAMQPLVLLNCHDTSRRFPSVRPADVSGAFAAVTALITAGHRRIAHLAGEDWGEASRDRAKGYRQALATADIGIDPTLTAQPVWTVDSGRAATARLLKLPDPPTAFFCFNDRAAIGCYEAIAQAGLQVPRDISVVGFDNEDLVAHLSPPLTTMILPHDDMGRWSVQVLTGAQTGGPRQVKMDCPIVLRQSIGKPGRH
jgi:LacI family transcriptional regulator